MAAYSRHKRVGALASGLLKPEFEQWFASLGVGVVAFPIIAGDPIRTLSNEVVPRVRDIAVVHWA